MNPGLTSLIQMWNVRHGCRSEWAHNQPSCEDGYVCLVYIEDTSYRRPCASWNPSRPVLSVASTFPQCLSAMLGRTPAVSRPLHSGAFFYLIAPEILQTERKSRFFLSPFEPVTTEGHAN